jgi:hypothetical protein
MADETFSIVINKSNHVIDNRFTYRFGRNVDFSDMSIAMDKVSIIYTWMNITALKNNNTFGLIHPNGATTNATLSITIPDGGYEIETLNQYLRWYLIQNGYVITNNLTGDQTVSIQQRSRLSS